MVIPLLNLIFVARLGLIVYESLWYEASENGMRNSVTLSSQYYY